MDAASSFDLLKTLSSVGHFIVTWWPMDTTQTIKTGLELAALAYGAFGANDWSKVKTFVTDKCLEVEDLTISNPEKLDMVVDAAWEFVPKKIKMLPFVTRDLLEILVVQRYNSVIKPKLKIQQEKQFLAAANNSEPTPL